MTGLRLRLERVGRRLPMPVRALASAALLGIYAFLMLRLRLTPWHDAILLPCVIWVAMAWIEPLRPRPVLLTALAVCSLCIGLAYVWAVGFAGRNYIFGGIFPLADAGEYYWDAERVLHGAAMNGGGARRPIFSAVLAGVLRLCGGSMRVAHVVTMLFWAGAGAFAIGEVWRTHGRKVACAALILFLLFARRYVGFVQSEGIGAPLGALAFGLIWRAQSMKQGWQATFLGALLLQSLALLSRPGPLLVIVGLVAWAVVRSEPRRRPRMLAASVGVVAAAFLFQNVVRTTTTTAASYMDALPILYGLFHGEDYRFVWTRNPWLLELPEPSRAMAILRLLGRELADQPLSFVVAPLRCLASWFYLPQGFFGLVWLNPDDRALEDAAAVRQSMADHGFVGPAILWVRTLGVYSLVNAIAMAGAAAAFLVALVRAAVRAWRGRRLLGDSALAFASLGILFSLPLLPPWITEGAQILASVFLYVVLAVITSMAAPPAGIDAPPSQRLGPVIAAALAGLVLVAELLPVRPPAPACEPAAAGRVLADLDRSSMISLRTLPCRAPDPCEPSPPTPSDVQANLAMLRRNHNPKFADSIEETLASGPRLVPAYDACHTRMMYVVDSRGLVSEGRWAWMHTTPMLQSPLERTEE